MGVYRAILTRVYYMAQIYAIFLSLSSLNEHLWKNEAERERAVFIDTVVD